MEVASILKLLIRNAKLIIGFPILLALIVYASTRNEEHQYVSGMTIFTGIASGFSLGSIEGNTSRVDMFNTNNQFDNFINILKSKETNIEVALRLLAQGLSLSKPEKLIISPENFRRLHEDIPDDVKALIVPNNPDLTFAAFYRYFSSSKSNYFSNVLASNDPHYSINALSKINVRRVGNSDLVDVSYQLDDPGIAYQTLKILASVFMKNYKQLKQMQTDAVVKYFEGELAKISIVLRDAENKLLEVYRGNSIINYNEQTRYIAEQKEYFETDYVKEKMNFASIKAAVSALEQKINFKDRIFLKNDSIVKLRNELYLLNLKLAENRINISTSQSSTTPQSGGSIAYLQKIDSVSQLLRREVVDAVRLKNSVEGIASDKILNEWLDKVVENESSRAKIAVMEDRLRDFKNTYVRMAPVGALIKRIEREIDISEQQYLSILHGLNMAKLRMQDVEMSSTIKMLNYPQFPLIPLPSHRKLVIIAAFVGAMLFIIMLLIAFEYFDSSIRNAERAKELIGLPILSIFPHIYKNKEWIEQVKKKLVHIAAQELANRRSTALFRIALVSIIEGEGKSTLGSAIADAMQQLGLRVCMVGQDTQQVLVAPPNADQYDVVIYELSSILSHPVPLGVVQDVDQFVLVVRANRGWEKSDQRALEVLTSICAHKPVVLLNGVEEEGLEHFLGEIDKPRSVLRIWIKRLLTASIFSKKNLKIG